MKTALLFSGGVDSSVSLSILKEKGHDLTAFYLKIWLEDELSYLGNCPWSIDMEYVKNTCKQLNVPFEIVSMQQEYKEKVISYTIEQIKNGNTPNPDVFCNKNIKLGAFFDKYENDFDFFATGHYSRRTIQENDFYLCMTNDSVKDQSYFLAYTQYQRLKKCLFPIGNMDKVEVRKYAIEKNLPSATRPDSQGICFLGNIKFKEFVKFYCGTKNGKIIEYETGKILGQHEGFWFYTIGQRQGIGLSGGPWYVVKKNTEENVVFVSKSYYDEFKIRDFLSVRNFNWLVSEEKIPKVGESFFVKLRHGKNFNEAVLIKKTNENIFEFNLKDNDQGIAPGQFFVLYSDKIIKNEIVCVGAAEILK